MRLPIKLTATIDPREGVRNRLPESLKVKLGLERLGYPGAPDRDFIPGADGPFFDNLRAFQKARGLAPDGVVKPGGPTERAVNEALARAPRPTPPPALATPPETVSAAAYASHRRLAKAAVKSRDPGDLPAFMVGATRLGGETGLAEVGDLIHQVRTFAEDSAERLRRTLEDYLPDHMLARIDRASAASAARDRAVAQRAAPERSAQGQDDRTPDPAGDDDRRFKEYRRKLRPREGGFVDDPMDEGGPTMKGVSTELLKAFNAKYPEKGLPSEPAKLSEEQITAIFREEFYDRPQIGKLARVPGLAEAAPKLAEQVFDNGVLHGIGTAGRWLQEALDEHLGTDLKSAGPDGARAYDGIVGSRTRAAVAEAVKLGRIAEVNNAVVDKRLTLMRNHRLWESRKGGWVPRAESFRQ